MRNQEQSFGTIIGGPTPVIVEFYAEWCMPCRMLTPILKALSADMGDQVRILKVDVDRNPEVASKYGVFSVPTIFLFQDGEIRWKGSGARTKEELKRIILSETSLRNSA